MIPVDKLESNGENNPMTRGEDPVKYSGDYSKCNVLAGDIQKCEESGGKREKEGGEVK